MTSQELRDRARTEIDEIGPEPTTKAEREVWAEERRGAIVLLSELAGGDVDLLKEAALDPADGSSGAGRDLLIAAAKAAAKASARPA